MVDRTRMQMLSAEPNRALERGMDVRTEISVRESKFTQARRRVTRVLKNDE
jgi:hypothetical protein